MTRTDVRGERPPPVRTLDSRNPATGDLVDQFPVHGQSDVDAAVQRARAASRWWVQLGYAGRGSRLRSWRRLLAARIDELAQLIHREGGKPVGEATLEVALAIDHLDWAARHASTVLGRRTVLPGVLAANHTATVDYLPYGVVGVIGPWNYPVYTPMGSIGSALAAGNTVVFKPSEYTPAVGAWLVRTFAEVVGDRSVLQLVTGFGDTGAAVCASGVDKIAFTGSSATARRVMAACAQSLTPVLLECGGKDVLIVDSDADLAAAADAAVWGGMSNAGQTCIGIERVYVLDAVYEPFLAAVAERAGELRPGTDPAASYGPMTMPGQIDVVRRHVADAIARGGRAVVGGPQSVRPPYVDPVVLTDVPEDSAAVREETFGPTLVVNPVRDVDDAVRRANATGFGLGAAVFSRSRGMRIARRLRCGMVSVNSVVGFAGVPALPFGGVGESGFGRVHAAEGLREFARTQAVARQRVSPPVLLTTFRRTARAIDTLRASTRLRHG